MLQCGRFPCEKYALYQKYMQDQKYLGVPINAQMESTTGKQKLIDKMHHRILIISKNSSNVQEARILHNMLVCQVAAFFPICISMSLKECAALDKFLTNAYQYRLKYMPSVGARTVYSYQKREVGSECQVLLMNIWELFLET
jgi:hypothetical protein